MPRIHPVSWVTLRKIFEADGWADSRGKGDHMAFTKKGLPRPIIIRKYDEISSGLIHNNMGTAGV